MDTKPEVEALKMFSEIKEVTGTAYMKHTQRPSPENSSISDAARHKGTSEMKNHNLVCDVATIMPAVFTFSLLFS